jgi:DNA-binding NtrC family response regulator
LYRLQVINIEVPPLRKRVEDILPLARFLAQKFGKKHNQKVISFDPSTIKQLLAYDWPGNIRELENVIEYALISSRGETISPEHLPSTISNRGSLSFCDSLREVEKNQILKVLFMTKGNHVQASKILRISKATLYRKLKIYNISTCQ